MLMMNMYNIFVQATMMSDAGSYRSDGEDTITRTPAASTRDMVIWKFVLISTLYYTLYMYYNKLLLYYYDT